MLWTFRILWKLLSILAAVGWLDNIHAIYTTQTAVPSYHRETTVELSIDLGEFREIIRNKSLRFSGILHLPNSLGIPLIKALFIFRKCPIEANSLSLGIIELVECSATK